MLQVVIQVTGTQLTDGGDHDGLYSLSGHNHNGIYEPVHSHPYLGNGYLQYRGLSDANDSDGEGVTAYYIPPSTLNKPTGNDHALLTLSYSAAWAFQMAGDWRTGNMYTRNQENNNWESWAQLWSSKDFSNNSSNWDTAYGWGDHADAGYLTGGAFLPLTGGTLSNRLIIDKSVAGNGGWDDCGILLKNNNASAGETAVAHQNISTGSNYWIEGLNQDDVFKLAYGTSFTDGNVQLQVTTSGNLTASGNVTATNAVYAGTYFRNGPSDMNQMGYTANGAEYNGYLTLSNGQILADPVADIIRMGAAGASAGLQVSTAGSRVGIGGVPHGTDALNMHGSIHMQNNSINYVTQLHFNDNVRFHDEGNDSFLNFTWGDAGGGGIKFKDKDGNQQGIIYGDGEGSFGLLDKDGQWAISLDGDSYVRLHINGAAEAEVTSTGISLSPGNYFSRESHSSGHLCGSYNNIGINAAMSNPIYTIGNGYNPANSTLVNMYGIGYAESSSATFLSGNLDTGGTGWGMYVAADGDARIFLNASKGHINCTGKVYAGGVELANVNHTHSSAPDHNHIGDVIQPRMIQGGAKVSTTLGMTTSSSGTQMDITSTSWQYNTYYCSATSGSKLYCKLPAQPPAPHLPLVEGTIIRIGTDGRDIGIIATVNSPLRWDSDTARTSGTYTIGSEVDWVNFILVDGCWTRFGASGNN